MQVLIVNTSTYWATEHPHFEDSELITRLVANGHVTHDVPIPFDRGDSDGAAALTLLPFGIWGDVMLGLGHRAAFIRHRRKIVVVDDEVIAACDSHARGGTSDRRNLMTALEESETVVCLTMPAQDYVSSKLGVLSCFACGPRGLIEIIGPSAP